MSLDLHVQSPIQELTEHIVQSYSEVDTTHHLDHCPLPTQETIIAALADLMDILFPGYRRRDRLNMNNVGYYVGEKIDRLYEVLTTQISRAFCHGKSPAIACTPEKKESFEILGRNKSLDFLRTIPVLREQLAKDVQAAKEGDPACTSFDEVIFCYPCLEAITTYRLAHELHKLEVPLIPRIMTEWAHSKTGIDIHPGATIGDYFFIDHGTGVVIGETCKIGNHVKLYQGVTLGALSFPKDEHGNFAVGKRHPTIEDDVIIYANATILGGNTVIGRGSVIGSSVWLIESVAPGTKVTIETPHLVVREDKNFVKA
ncbi:MAG: serine acetyltransferase [Thermoguttaceae bacterium]|nr:serine acetyltransferase [Thermoguttaceae bacterium]